MSLWNTATAIFDGLEKAYDVAKKLKNAELLGVIADLQLKIVDLKGESADLGMEILDLRRQVDEFRVKEDIRSKVVLGTDGYYLTESVQGYGNGPFCTYCLDVDGKLVTLTEYHCVRCAKQGGAE